MPELPEVETVKRGLEPVLTGSSFSRVTLNRPDLRIPFPTDMKEKMEGRKCLALRRRGKYLWVDMDGGDTLVIHLGMSGSFIINPEKVKPHDHVIFEMNNENCVVYNDPRRFGMMFFVKADAEDKHPAFMHMGPEPLGNGFHADYLKDVLLKRQSPIKTTLLDQTVVAGLGNIYVCEALYMAGINPLTKACKISKPRLTKLVSAIRDVLNQAIEVGGSSLRDHRQADGTMGYFQHHFQVYGREGAMCSKSGGNIKKIVQSGRSTFYSPKWQK
jgi:formamidopyrimidine-DNA glycosylase